MVLVIKVKLYYKFKFAKYKLSIYEKRVQFIMKNVLSFKDETVLDMSAIKVYKEHNSNLIETIQIQKSNL